MGEDERMERAENPARQQDSDVIAARVASLEATIGRRDKLAWVKTCRSVVTLMLSTWATA